MPTSSHPPPALEAPAPGAPLIGRRALLAGLTAVLVLRDRAARAEEVSVPVELQAELFVKVAAYDRSFAARAGDRARVVVVSNADDDGSKTVAAQMTRALAGIDTIGGIPKEVSAHSFTSAAAIAELCHARRPAIVYFAPGIDRAVPAIASALSGVDVLSLAAVPDYVARGIVLGAELASGKPKLLIHLPQARSQNVQLSPELLKLMKVYK
ncbi:MAG: YfiR family protein [Polyangiaceae bacterium]